MKHKQFFNVIFLLLIALVVVFSANKKPFHKRNEYPNSRIDSIDVVHYTINLTEVDFVNCKLKGFTDLQIVLQQDGLDTILLDLIALTVDSIWVDEISIDSFTYDYRWIKIPLPFQYDKGTSIQVSVFYHGKPARDPAWGGFYFSGNTAYNMGVGMGSFPHNFGRAWYACVDNFIDRATYDYFITVDNGLTAVCSGVLEELYNNEDGTTTYHWRMKQEIPTYLCSVAISDYIAIHDTLDGVAQPIPSSLYVHPKDSLNAVRSFRNLPKYLKHFEAMFGPYSWDRIGFVIVPFRGGAMEHAANIAVNNRSVDGTLGSEMLFVHEFAHNWFGNLVTCQRAEDMWLNEGWASYAEALYIEREYGTDRFKEYVRENLHNVLRAAHIMNNEYYAVAGIPHEMTYSGITYNKGASIAHTLRSYLGDEKFFKGLKLYFSRYKYRDISSADFRDFWSKTTETDLDDFFNSWVFSPGFPHFSIDSFTIGKTLSGYNVRLFLQQKLKGTDAFSFSNRIEVTFMDDNWHRHIVLADFSGEYSEKTFFLPFNPSVVMVDLDEKISDATTDHFKVIDSPGDYDYDATYCIVHLKEVSDSIFLRVVHNWIAPDGFKSERKNQRISTSRYWNIEGIFPSSFMAGASFQYNTRKSGRSGGLDHDLNISPNESLIMFYRESADYDWEICDHSVAGDNLSGKVLVTNLLPGEYALGQSINH